MASLGSFVWEHFVKILFIRNLDVVQTSEEFARQIYHIMDRSAVEKVYKFKNYAYVHLVSREYAEKLMERLRQFYHGSLVEVSYAKPPNKFTDRNFRDKALISRRANSQVLGSPGGSSGTGQTPSPSPSPSLSLPRSVPSYYYDGSSSSAASGRSDVFSPNSFQHFSLNDNTRATHNDFLLPPNPRQTVQTGFVPNSYRGTGSNFIGNTLGIAPRASYTPIRGPVRTDLLSSIAGPSFFDPYQFQRAPSPTPRLGAGYHMSTYSRFCPQNTSADLEDLVNNILKD